jgi:hypothetical protein
MGWGRKVVVRDSRILGCEGRVVDEGVGWR